MSPEVAEDVFGNFFVFASFLKLKHVSLNVNVVLCLHLSATVDIMSVGLDGNRVE